MTSEWQETTQEWTELMATERYEVIQDEALTNCHQKDLTLAGTLFQNVLFKNVAFRRCVFFGAKWRECQFLGCTFADCRFEFSHISRCNFISSVFLNCRWDCSSFSAQCTLQWCQLDPSTLHQLSQFDEQVWSSQCFGLRAPSFKKAAS